MEKPQDTQAGCYFDSEKGIYIGAHVIRLAISKGWTANGRFNKEIRYTDEHLSALIDYSDLWHNAEMELNSSDLCPDGHFWGRSPQNDWGLWENPDYTKAKALFKISKSIEEFTEEFGEDETPKKLREAFDYCFESVEKMGYGELT